MKTTKLISKITSLPAGITDLITPVSIYLRIRDKFPNAILLESSDYHGNRNSKTYVCFEVMANFKVEDGKISKTFIDGNIQEAEIKNEKTLVNELNDFISSFEIENFESPGKRISPDNYRGGLFGYTSYDAIQYFETIKFKDKKNNETRIPQVNYSLYRFVLSFNHFNNQLHLLENITESTSSRYEEVISILADRTVGQFNFQMIGEEYSNIPDKRFIEMVNSGKDHCKKGNVFQIVLSRQFSHEFKGDEFNVYRSLRSINPSPYLFYFDYGGFKIFGSSPEAQIVIEENVARINPIAGTFKRTGDDEKDRELAIQLSNDEKENAEHVMLVDLARNDLARNSKIVRVNTFREVQFYSHVIHLVSVVTGELDPNYKAYKIFGDSFPAGTLSGAPKFKAMELIDELESRNRGYYGGALGYIGFNGEMNHAIMIRSFLSKNNKLYYEGGAGVTAASVEENELKEVNNKLGALRQAVKQAENL
ncbi:MAG: anthranilate synthase component I family protein [Bacteroidales bacterium]|nr:anthranilate synthase component I family protein [Bacteroidales bacterium]MCF8389481.1 anthranilate synthase component I family protein [Bacteroidales bacterium]